MVIRFFCYLLVLLVTFRGFGYPFSNFRLSSFQQPHNGKTNGVFHADWFGQDLEQTRLGKEGEILLKEEFENNKNKWDIYKSNVSEGQISEGRLVLSSFHKKGTSRYIELSKAPVSFSIETTLIQSKKNAPTGGYGIIFGFKDWQNYHYFIVERFEISIGEVIEGIQKKRVSQMFCSRLALRPESITLNILNTEDKAFFSVNGDIQVTSKALEISSKGIGFVVGGKGSIKIENLLVKDLGSNGSSGDKPAYSKSGTGILLSTDGYLATNHHVVRDASEFLVSFFIDGNPVEFKAKKVLEDVENDLAVLKIEDQAFVPLSKIRYSFKPQQSINVGASVFSIGYPLQSILGKEPKFVDGRISSKTGYKNSISTFQTTVPLQPGNSGSPLFNDRGELIGIMNSVVTNTENVSYGIKLSVLTNLIELLSKPIELPNTDFPEGVKMEELVKDVSRYVAFIKVK